MSYLNQLPYLRNFLYCLSLRIGSFFAALICIIHPAIFVSIYFNSNPKLHDWATNTAGFMVALLFVVSIVLFVGTILERAPLVRIWVYFSVMFILSMFVIVVLLAITLIYKGKFWIGQAIGHVCLYIFFLYLMLIVNSYAICLEGPKESDSESDHVEEESQEEEEERY